MVERMNERIRELAEQARKHFPKTESSGEFWVFDEQKFAELIVRECSDLFKNVLISVETEHGHQSVMASKFIRNHFGIEE